MATLARTVEGLLFADDFDRADGAPGSNWSGGSIVSERLRLTANGSNARELAGADLSEMVVQQEVAIAAGAATGFTVRHVSNDHTYYVQSQENQNHFLFVRAPGYSLITGPAVFAYTAGVPFPVKAHVKDSYQKVWIGPAGAAVLNGTNTVLNAAVGTGGLHRNSGQVESNKYRRYRNNSVVCSGLPTGHKLRVGTRVAVEVGGTATVDLDKDLCPLPKVEVLNSSDSVIDELTPANGVWGGDEYALAAAEPPDAPTLSVSGISPIGANLSLSAYSHPQETPHAQSQLQVTLAADTEFAAPFVDVTQVSRTLSVAGLDPETEYIARGRDQSDNDLWSDWSTAAPFETLALSVFTERKAWAFVLDGHVFYVLGAHGDRTLVCDLMTGQWHLWHTADLPWNMHRGVMWREQVLAADAALPRIWKLDPASTLDEGEHPITRCVTGFLPLRGRNSVAQGSFRLTASVGEPDAADVLVRMRFSDDEGETWSQYYGVALRVDDFAQPLRFRSLGRIRAPGRLWEVEDSGGLVRIDGADADL